jgi:hypothetical protein
MARSKQQCNINIPDEISHRRAWLECNKPRPKYEAGTQKTNHAHEIKCTISYLARQLRRSQHRGARPRTEPRRRPQIDTATGNRIATTGTGMSATGMGTTGRRIVMAAAARRGSGNVCGGERAQPSQRVGGGNAVFGVELAREQGSLLTKK